ncbi:MAG: pseudouridine synthase [Miltoncostaeaceae bacterium]
MAEEMRVHRALAQAGFGSRRTAEGLVAEGRVTVNGEVAHVGQKVTPSDRIEVDGAPVGTEPLRAFLLHKDAGVVTTANDPQGRPTVLDGLPDDVRLYPVGRLDRDTTGALIVTNDGELAHRLMHPSYSIPKTYEVLLRGQVGADTVRRLREGVELDDGRTASARVERMERRSARGTWLKIELTEGRNRQIRRMGIAVDHRVERLHRSLYCGVGVGGLSPGEHRPLRAEEWSRMRRAVGLREAA